MKNQVPGARWLRCDLHLHTPFDSDRGFGEDLRAAIDALKKEKPQRLGEIAERFVQACRAAINGKGLDLVALTDHNSIDGYRYLKPQFDLLAQQARDQHLPMPAILPGVEFSVGGERPIHFLVIFAASTEPDAIDGAIQHVFATSDCFDPKTGTPRATGQSVDDFLRRLYDYCQPPSGDRSLKFVVLPAHADGGRGLVQEVAEPGKRSTGEITVATAIWDQMKGHLRQRAITRREWHGFQTSRPFEKLPPAYRELLWRWAAAKAGDDWDQIAEGQRRQYRERLHWPLVESSDPHRYEEIGSRYTWLKMEVPDVEGIRLALLDPESRLRRMADGPPGQLYPQLQRIRVHHTDFFEELDLSFNPCLTTLIGGRGSGKSTLIEYLRYALDRTRKEDFSGDGSESIRDAVQALLTHKQERDFHETEGTLLPDSEIEIDVMVAQRQYRIRRTADSILVVRDPDTAAEEHLSYGDVRALIAPRILSQGQIARIAKDPVSQRSELDGLLDRDQLASITEDQRRERERISQLQARRARLKERLKTLPARKTELQKVRDQITFLEQGGKKDVLSRFHGFDQERRWLDNAVDELETQARGVEEQAQALRTGGESLAEGPSEGPTQTWVEAVSKRFRDRMGEAASRLLAEATALRQLATTVSSERAERWQPAYDEARKEYDRLVGAMQARGVDFSQHERLLQQQALLTREVANLEAISDEIERVAQELNEARGRLVQVHERRLAQRRQQAKTLEELDADVRLEVLPFRDRKDFEARREEWFSGAGVQERDWKVLVEYVFAPNGLVADRIGLLVEALRADVEQTSDQGRAATPSESQVATLLGSTSEGSLTKHFFNALEHSERARLDEMERFLPEDAVELRVRAADGVFTPITTGSVGQKSTAILSLLLSAGDQPLIIDQPEADLDNRYIYDVVVSLLRRRKFSRQIIIATHNANIPVNGDAELIVALGVDNRLGTILASGSIDRWVVKNQVSVIMEGSAEAFRLRGERYGY